MPNPFRTLRSARGWLLARLAILVVVAGIFGRAVDQVRRRRREAVEDWSASRRVLPSLYEAHPEATRAPRRPLGVRTVPLDRIVGTMRHPSQNTADFLPLPELRGENWRGRWQRITRANDRLEVLPPVELFQVGNEYYVADGHNRVAAARQAGALDTDAAVTQLIVPGLTTAGPAGFDATSLIGSDSVRQAARGHLSRTVEQRPSSDRLSRQDLLRATDAPLEAPPPTDTGGEGAGES
jgi:hypothetical protein